MSDLEPLVSCWPDGYGTIWQGEGQGIHSSSVHSFSLTQYIDDALSFLDSLPPIDTNPTTMESAPVGDDGNLPVESPVGNRHTRPARALPAHSAHPKGITGKAFLSKMNLLVVPGNLTRVKQRGAAAGYRISKEVTGVRPCEGSLSVHRSNLRGDSRMGCS
jgi:hypothetical protein